MVKSKPQNPRFSNHAQDRWEERILPNSDLAGDDITKWQAWNESLTFAIPDHWGYGPNGTIHPPTNAIFIWGQDPTDAGPYAIATVMQIDRAIRENGALTGTILFECPDCGLRYKPTQAPKCPWCAADYELPDPSVARPR